jgi:hypothetical protein
MVYEAKSCTLASFSKVHTAACRPILEYDYRQFGIKKLFEMNNITRQRKVPRGSCVLIGSISS